LEETETEWAQSPGIGRSRLRLNSKTVLVQSLNLEPASMRKNPKSSAAGAPIGAGLPLQPGLLMRFLRYFGGDHLNSSAVEQLTF
jgi:hypothetical protein